MGGGRFYLNLRPKIIMLSQDLKKLSFSLIIKFYDRNLHHHSFRTFLDWFGVCVYVRNKICVWFLLDYDDQRSQMGLFRSCTGVPPRLRRKLVWISSYLQLFNIRVSLPGTIPPVVHPQYLGGFKSSTCGDALVRAVRVTCINGQRLSNTTR